MTEEKETGGGVLEFLTLNIFFSSDSFSLCSLGISLLPVYLKHSFLFIIVTSLIMEMLLCPFCDYEKFSAGIRCTFILFVAQSQHSHLNLRYSTITLYDKALFSSMARSLLRYQNRINIC